MSSELRPGRGVHAILDQDHQFIFIDACMQIWPDADFANAHRHGVTSYAVTAWNPDADLDSVIEGCMYWHLIARKFPNLQVISGVEDIRNDKQMGKAGFIITAQGGEWIGNKLHRIEALQRLGLRMMLLAYNRTNQLCDGILDWTEGGLSRFGKLVVQECNRVGIVLDCTHTGKKSTLEIIDNSQYPCVFTHSNPKSIVDSIRNIDDEQIKACAARGGVIGLAPWGPLVIDPDNPHWPTVDEFIDMIDHVAELTGSTDHIGIGTDMSIGTYPDHEHDPWGEPDYPNFTAFYGEHVTADIRSPKRALDGFCEYPEVVNVIDSLLARGYNETDIAKILGENFLRVFEIIWK